MIIRPQIKSSNISTTNLSKPNTSDFIISNTRNKDIKIFYITLVPDAFFKSNGNVTVEIDGDPILLEFVNGELERTTDLTLQLTPYGSLFPRNSVLKVFTWLDIAGTGELSIFITIGE